MDLKDFSPSQKGAEFWFKAKEDLIRRMLIKIKKKKQKILIIGAGTGEDIKIFADFGEVYVTDINKESIAMIKENCSKQVCDACNLDFKDNTFDIVASFDVFEHIENDKLAVNEVFRVLKKHGCLIFSVPAFQALYSSHDSALEHKRRYSKESIKYLMKNFTKKYLCYWNFFLFIPIAIIRLIKKKSKPRTDSKINLPRTISRILFMLLKIENILISKDILRFPFGLSIWGICKK